MKRVPYWLAEGTERCHVCSHPHAFEVTVFCVSCDRPLCMHCVVIERVSGEAWCPSCREEARD